MGYTTTRVSAAVDPGITDLSQLDANAGDMIVADGEDQYSVDPTAAYGRSLLDIASAALLADEVRSELLSDAIANGETDLAPTQNAVFDALALKVTAAGGDASATVVTPTGGSAARTLATRFADEINLEDTSLVFDDDETDNAAELATLIEEAASSGRKLWAPRPRTLWVGDCAASPEDDVWWRAVPGFLIKGLDSGTTSVVKINGGAFRPKLFVDGMVVDNSLRTFASEAASGTALTIQNLSEFDIRGFRAQSTDDSRDEMGDTGLDINQCDKGRVWNPVLIGQPDLGIYITGGPSTDESDDYGDIEIYGPVFRRCDQAMSTKRQSRRAAVFGGVVYECRVGIGTAEGDSGMTEIDPGRELMVLGTRFKRIGSRAINGRGPSRITARIQVEDFGFDPDDVATLGGHNYAVLLTGPSYCDIDAQIAQRDWSGAGLRAFYLSQLTLDSGTYTPTGNSIRGTIEGVEKGVEEGANVTGNHYDLICKTDVTTPITLASGSTSRAKVRQNDGSVVGEGVILDTYTADDTWAKRNGAQKVIVELLGGGGGGGGGAKNSASNAVSGGGGGGGGRYVRVQFAASALASTVAVTVGTAGASGAGSSSDGVAGSDGGAGGNSTFGAHVTAYGGGGGAGGPATNAGSGGGGSGGWRTAGANGSSATGGTGGSGGGQNGGNAASTSTPTVFDGVATGGGGCIATTLVGGNGAGPALGGGGGAGGGGVTAANSAQVGGNTFSALNGSAAVTGGAATGAAGSVGIRSATGYSAGGSGGGGNASGAGGAGGAGTVNTGNGGGGGGAAHGGDGGAGGLGGTGLVRVWTYF